MRDVIVIDFPGHHKNKHVTISDESWVVLARVVRPQGRRGEVLAEIFTDFPERFSERRRLFLKPAGKPVRSAMREAKVESQWLHKGRVVLKFADVDSITEAEKLRGLELVTPAEDRIPLEGDAVYVSDLMGAHIIDVRLGRAEDVGEIIDVEPEGVGPAMLVVRTAAGEEPLIPFVKAYLKRVDLREKRIEMELPEDLLTMQSPLSAREERSLSKEASREHPE